MIKKVCQRKMAAPCRIVKSSLFARRTPAVNDVSAGAVAARAGAARAVRGSSAAVGEHGGTGEESHDDTSGFCWGSMTSTAANNKADRVGAAVSHDQRPARDDDDARRQAVETVDDVDRVGDVGHRERRERDRDLGEC